MHYQGTMGQIDNCIVENNQKDGIAVWTAAAIDIENSTVRNNGLNGWGNGLSIWDAYAGISNSKIENHVNGNGIGHDVIVVVSDKNESGSSHVRGKLIDLVKATVHSLFAHIWIIEISY